MAEHIHQTVLVVDGETGVAYLEVPAGQRSREGIAVRTVAVTSLAGVNVDFDADGAIVGIEILDPALLPREVRHAKA